MRTVVPISCTICGKTFHVKPYRQHTAKCCSKTCQVAYINSRHTPETEIKRLQKAKERQQELAQPIGYEVLASDGYVLVKVSPKKWRRKQRIVMEQLLDRSLKPNEIIHHIDGNSQNNAPSNLLLCTHSIHRKNHWASKEQRWSLAYSQCISCGRTDRPHNGHGLCWTCYKRTRG